MKEWISVAEASRKAGVSDRTIRNWIAKSKLSAKKEKGQWLIDEGALSEIGNEVSDTVGKSETIPVPLEHYDGLTTRLGQLEAENSHFRLMLKAHDDEVDKLQAEREELKKELEYYRQPWHRRWRRKRKKDVQGG